MRLDLSKVNYSFYDNKKRNFVLPTELTEDLAEICGIHIGDGHLGFRPRGGRPEYLVQCEGDPIKDKGHYDDYMKKTWKKLFNLNLNMRYHPCGTYGFRIYSKAIATFFNTVLEMPFGKKTHTITIPNIIKRTCKSKVSNEMIACIRGIIDTDFFLISKKGYPLLAAWFANRKLVLELFYYFGRLGFEPRLTLDNYYYNTSAKKYLMRHMIRIGGRKYVRKWFELIGTHNPKFYKRYLSFDL